MTTLDTHPVILKIQALLAKAESTDFGPEREAYQAKADQLMVKYAVEQYQIDQARKERGERPNSVPITKDLLIPWTRPMGTGSDYTYQLFHGICFAVGTRSLFRKFDYVKSAGSERPEAFYRMTMVGYDADISYVEMLFLSLRIQMLKMLTPEPNAALSFDENVFSMHEAGMKWERICTVMNAMAPSTGWPIVKWDRENKDNGRLRAAAKRWAAKIGAEYHATVSHESYRRSFAEAFNARIFSRLNNARHEDDSTALVLKSRVEDVEKLFRDLLADLERAAAARRSEEPAAKARKGRVAKYREPRHDRIGAEAGRRAAERADLSKPGTRVGDSRSGELS